MICPGLAGICTRLIYPCIMAFNMEIDAEKTVYVFTHGRRDLRARAISILKDMGFGPNAIVDATPDRVGAPGDYMAMLWMPRNPDHIKIQKITKVEQVEPVGMIGLWKGVTADDIDTVQL